MKLARKRWQQARSAIVYGLYLAVAILVLLEIALRAIAPINRDLATMLYLPGLERSYEHIESLEALMQTTVLGFVPQRLRCGFILNSRSFRTPEYTQQIAPSTRRIVTIGDSFNFDSNGVAYEQMFSSVLEERLSDATEAQVDVFALGVPGVGPRFELRLWQLERELLRPETVIVAFFIGNDFTDEKRFGRRERLSQTLARLSFTFRLVRNIKRAPSPPQMPSGKKRPTGGYSVETDDYGNLKLSRAELVAIEASRLRIALKQNQAEIQSLAESNAAVLERFRHDVEATGANFLVLLIPDVFQVDAQLLEEAVQSLDLTRDEVDLGAPQRSLIVHLESFDIEYLDLLPDFRGAAENGSQLYWPYDTHWNSQGHELAGELLARRILSDPER